MSADARDSDILAALPPYTLIRHARIFRDADDMAVR